MTDESHLPPLEPEDIAVLRERLWEAEDAIRAIRGGEIDALVLPGPRGDEELYPLRSADQPYRTLLEHMQEGAVILTPAGDVLYCNGYLGELLEVDPDRLLGSRFADVVAPGDRPRFSELLAAARGDPTRGELTLCPARGAPFGAYVTGTRLRVEGADALCLVVTNLSRARPGDENRLHQTRRLEAVGRLAGGIAHEVNNQLSVILGFAGFVLERADIPDEARSDVMQVREAAVRAAAVVRQLLAFSRRQRLELEPVSIHELLRDLEPVLHRLLGEGSRLQLELDAARDWIRGDRSQLEQVLLNLVLNAVEAMPEGGLLELGTSNVEPAHGDSDELAGVGVEPGPHILLTVRDTGHGIPEEVRGQVFEPFFTTKAVGKGMGLGLATAYGIVKQSGGYIWLDSKVGAGTTFRIYLPLAEGEPSGETA